MGHHNRHTGVAKRSDFTVDSAFRTGRRDQYPTPKQRVFGKLHVARWARGIGES